MKATILVNLKDGNVNDLWDYLRDMGMLNNDKIEVIDIFEST